MRQASIVLAVALLVAADANAAEQTMTPFFPYRAQTQTLDNGLRVIVIPMSSQGLVAYWSIVRTGSRDEYEPGRTGFAHFFEHMMFRGTEKVPQEIYGRIVTELGADANAYTTDDLTAYHLGIAAADLERVMEIESDRFRNLSYAPAVFETEAGAVYGEYRKNRMSPIFALYEAMREKSFVEHTYGHTTMGYERDIKAMPGMFDYSREFFSRYYRPDNTVLLVVGDVEPERVVGLARRYYGDWERGYVPPRIRPEPAQRGERSVEVEYDGPALPLLWLSYKVDRFRPDDRQLAGASLLAELAFGETSEIHKSLVLDRQWVEFIRGEVDVNRDPGLFEIYTRIKDPARIDDVLAEIEKAIERARTEAPDPARLADLKSRLRYGFLMGLDTPDRVASALARFVGVTGGIEALETLYETYESITADEVRAAGEHYLRKDARTRGVLRGKP